jgi:integrase
MRVRLVGIHSVKATLASGQKVTYRYAWRGGPRIETDPADDHAFMAEFLRLTRDRPAEERHIDGLFPELIAAYRQSAKYQALKPSTLVNYDKAIDLIEAEFHSLEIKAIDEKGARSLFLDWRDGMAATPRTADYRMAVLARILSFAADRELIERNPLQRLERLSAGTRRETVWTDAQIAAFLAAAPAKLKLAMELARWTGQRQGDLLRLTWSAYDGTHIRLRQGKTGRKVRVRVYSQLKAMLDATPRQAVTILTTTRREPTPWTGDGFRASWRAVCEQAGVKGVTFHDLRGTFVTLAYRVHKATIQEIAEATGHSEQEAEAIIRKHYLAGESVIEKMERGNKSGAGV